MKRSIFFLYIALQSTLFASYFTIVEQSPNSVVFEWTAPELLWQNVSLPDDNYVVPSLGGLPLTRTSGAPQLPFDSFAPKLVGANARLTVLDSVYEIRGTPPLLGTQDADSLSFLGLTPFVASSFQPVNFAEYHQARARGETLHRVQVNPLKYNPALRQVQFLRYAKIRIETTREPVMPSISAISAADVRSSSGISPAVKVYTLQEGVYQISGADLQNSGVNPAIIDPNLLSIENSGRSVPFMMTGDEDGRFDAGDRLYFFAERLAGDGEYYHAYTDSNVFWLRWDGGGVRFSAVESGGGETIATSFRESLHFEKDVEYYNGDTNADIQESAAVPGEGWVWDSAIDPGDVFRTTFTLPGHFASGDSSRLRFRVRGQTLDAYPNSHHLRVRINGQLVYDGFFDDRQERIISISLKEGVLKENDNLFELESLRDNANAKSRFYFDWFEVDYRRKMIALDGFLRIKECGADVNWVQGFASRRVQVWDVKNRVAVLPQAVGSEWLAEIGVESAGLVDGNFARFTINGQLMFSGTRGISVAALDSETGQTLFKRSFDTYGLAAHSDTLAMFIRALPDSAVVLAASMDDGATSLRPSAIEALQSCGSQKIAQLKYRDSWAFIGRKGRVQPLAENLSPLGSGNAQAAEQLSFAGSEGFSVRFALPAGAGDSPVVFDEEAALSPQLKYVPRNSVSSFVGADYIVVTHKRFAEQAERLARYRETRNGFVTFIADIEEIYNAFNHGIPDAEALREFLRHAYHTGNPQPHYVLLFGDASWDPKFNLVNSKYRNYVPSLGNPVSDALLACFDGPDDVLPEISIGRIPVSNETHAQTSVDKIIEYEQAASASWKKNFLFISGGLDESEQRQFKNQSDNLAREFVDTAPTYGRPLFISKALENPEADFRSQILEAINRGALWTNFIGHAASRTWELMFNTPDIDDLSNKGRYPFISSMTCHTGRFAEPTQESFSEHFLLAPEKGSVGFWGTSGWGYSYEDYLYLRQIIPTVTLDSLRSLGDVVKMAKVKLWQRYGPGAHYRNLSLQYNLLGDPAVQLALARLPDLALQQQNIIAAPQMPSEADSSAVIRVIVENWGLVCRDSVDVTMTAQHTLSGKILSSSKRIEPLGLSRTVEFMLPLRGLAGIVEITFVVDASERIEELDENNNRQKIRLTVLSSDLQLIAPPQNALVPLDGLELKVQAPQERYDDTERYVFEIDTARTFNSTAFRASPPVRTHPLLIRWSPENLTPKQRYFWRVRRADIVDDGYSFTATFLTAVDSTFGWAQDADHERRNSYENVNWRGGYALSDHEIPLVIQSARSEQVGYALIEVDRRLAMTTARGHNVVVLDQRSGAVKATGWFDTYGQAGAPKELAQFVESVKPGDYVLAAISEEGGLNLTEEVYAAYESIGSALCRQIQFRYAWAILGRKGSAVGSVHEGLQPPGGTHVILKDTLYVLQTSGSLTSPKIGPASSWQSASIICDIPDSSVLQWSVWGHDVGGEVQALFTTGARRLDLGAVDARQYPFVSLEANFSGNGSVTPVLQFWQVEHAPTPDLALSPHLFTQSADSVMVGQTVRFFLDVYNIGLIKSDSAVVRIERNDTEMGRRLLADLSTPPIAADKYRPVEYEWTAAQPGNITFNVAVDPDLQVTEMNEANNSLIAQVFVRNDTLPPQVRLTVDDREIVDGDLVATQPTFIAKISDNNPEPIIDTTRVIVTLDGQRIAFRNSTHLTLTAGEEPDVRGVLRFTPTLPAGEHLLEIRVTDAARNPVETRLRFTVEENLVVRNVLNYPNPFADFTEFCFEISQAADISIKVYTVAGRLIRTLDGGRMTVGYNKLYWGGRDQDGDTPANGVYIYKLTAAGDETTVHTVSKLTIMR